MIERSQNPIPLERNSPCHKRWYEGEDTTSEETPPLLITRHASSVDLHAHTLLSQQTWLERQQNSPSREQNIVGCRARFISDRKNFVGCPETSLNVQADS